MVSHCFHDPDVIALIRKQWRCRDEALVVEDRYGNRASLLRMPARTYAHLASPLESGIELAAGRPAEIRADHVLSHLVERLLAAVDPYGDLVLQIRVPAYFFEAHPYALVEPFLLHGFTVQVDTWERLVDLAAAPDEILRRFATTARRKVRQGFAEAPKWHVHHGEPVAEELMRSLYEAARHTRAASGSRLRHPPETYLEDRARLIEHGKAALGIVEHGGFTGYLMVLVSRDLAFYFDGAWTGVRSEFANHLLHYRMMLFLREAGCRRYSAGYVLPDLLSGSDKVAGMARFKHGLGADLSPVYMLTLRRQTRVGALLAGARRSPLGPLWGRLRPLVGGA